MRATFHPTTLGKASRLLAEGRVVKAAATDTYRVVGDSGAYFVTVSADGRNAWCPCPARVTTCSHAAAVLLAIRDGVEVPVDEPDLDNPFDGLADDTTPFSWEVD